LQIRRLRRGRRRGLIRSSPEIKFGDGVTGGEILFVSSGSEGDRSIFGSARISGGRIYPLTISFIIYRFNLSDCVYKSHLDSFDNPRRLQKVFRKAFFIFIDIIVIGRF
jgi:hypothetical protein